MPKSESAAAVQLPPGDWQALLLVDERVGHQPDQHFGLGRLEGLTPHRKPYRLEMRLYQV